MVMLIGVSRATPLEADRSENQSRILELADSRGLQ
jgi:hypothetical protein